MHIFDFTVNIFIVYAQLVSMSAGRVRHRLTEETEIEIEEGLLTDDEIEWLRSQGILDVKGYHTDSDPQEITKVELNVSKLARFAFEYDVLKNVASTVATDILEYFRQSDETTHTTAEISQGTGRPKSSVSRALKKLTEKGKLTKVQSGVYRHPE